MADNLAVTAGTGATVATDQITNLHYQKIKLVDGAAESEAMIGGDATNGLDVDVTRLPNLVGGTVGVVSSLTNLASGTLAVVTSVGNVAGGSVVVTAGTIGSMPNIPGGTIGVVSSVTNLAGGTLGILTAGSVVMTAGTVSVLNTVGTVGKVEGGSIVMTVGTITAGTITAGTVKLDGRAARAIATYGTTFGGTAATYGTLVAAPGTGTAIYINDLSIVNTSGTVTCVVGFGTALNGETILAKGAFGPNGGIQKSYPLAVNGNTTNKDLVCYVSAAGTADFVVSYFVV